MKKIIFLIAFLYIGFAPTIAAVKNAKLKVLIESDSASRDVSTKTEPVKKDCDKKKEDKNDKCSCIFVPFKKDPYCGYIVQYDPCGNCTKIYRRRNYCFLPKKYNKKFNTDCGWKQVKQVRVGSPVQLYVNNLNFLKYNLNVESGIVEIAAGDPGLINIFYESLKKISFDKMNNQFNDSSKKECVSLNLESNTLNSEIITFFNTSISPLVTKFLKIYDIINIEDCDAASNINEFDALIKSNYKEFGINFRLDPGSYLTEKYKSKHKMYFNFIAKNKSEIEKCPTLSEKIKNDTILIKELEKGFNDYITALKKVYPFPDMEYQYNVPQVKNVDYLTFKLTLSGKEDKRNYRLNMKNEVIEIPVALGLKIDFSTGPMINYYKQDIFNLRADTIRNDKDSILMTGARIINDKTYNNHMGFATMLNIYPRQLPNLSLSPSFGIGVTTNLNYSILLGASVIVGRNQRFSLTYGYSYNSVKELSGANKLNDFVVNDYTIKTRRNFTNGHFFCLGYNIGSSKSGGSQEASPTKEEAPEKKKE